MSLGRSNSDLHLCSPFLLKFEGRMAQVSKQGTLTAQPHPKLPFQREPKKLRSTVLTEKRADNILLDLSQIRTKNAQELSYFSHRHDTQLPQDAAEKPVISLHSSCPSGLIVDGSLSRDFESMLRELDSIALPRRK